MGVNKVIYYGEVLVDMSQVTVTPESLEKGKTALDAKGELITGLHEGVEPNGDTLVWDGNTEGLDSIDFGISMYRVSDLYPTLSEVNAGATLIFFADATGVSQETAVAPSDAHSIVDVSEMFGVEAWMFYVNNSLPVVVACSQDITADGVTVKKGVYFGDTLSYYGAYIKALTISNYTGFPCVAIPANPELQEKTVTPSTSAQSVTADSGYDGLSKVNVNAMPTATQATPSITVSSAGKITASSTQTAGYVAAGTKSATKQLTTQAAKTVTPTTSEQTAVASSVYTTGAVTVEGDANLKAENIKSGVSIFGVDGSYEGNGGSGSTTAKCVTGGITVPTGNYSANKAIYSYTGLGFTPKHVMLFIASMISVSYNSSYKNQFLFAQGGLYDHNMSCYKVSSSSSSAANISPGLPGTTANFAIVLDDDGFTLKTGNSAGRIATGYMRFIAFGGCDFEVTDLSSNSGDSGGGSSGGSG